MDTQQKAAMDIFFDGGNPEVEIYQEETKIFKIVSITKVQDYKENWMNDSLKEVALFTLKSEDGQETRMFQSKYNRAGKPSGNLFYGMTYEKSQFYKPSVMKALLEAIREELGEKYEEEKNKAGGINSKFFLNKKLILINTPIGWMTRLQKLANDWKYQIDKGDARDYADIESFRDYFNLQDNIEEVEQTLGKDDIPF